MKIPWLWILIVLVLLAGGGAALYSASQNQGNQAPAAPAVRGFELQTLTIQGRTDTFYASPVPLDTTFVVRPPDLGAQQMPVVNSTNTATASTDQTAETATQPVELPTVPQQAATTWSIVNPGNCAIFLLNDKNHPVGNLPVQEGVPATVAANTNLGISCPAGNPDFYFKEVK